MNTTTRSCISQQPIVDAFRSTIHFMPSIKDKSDFAARMQEICTEKGIPTRGRAQAIAELLRDKIKYQAVQKWLNGTAKPNEEHATDLCKHFGVNYEWLMTGRGPKKSSDLCGYYVTDKLEIELISIIHDLPGIAKKEMIQHANQLKYVINEIKKDNSKKNNKD